MHGFLHAMRDEYKGDLKQIYEDDRWWEFETYLLYWLSALFVVVEGFNKLGLKDVRVQRLFNERLPLLKKLRHMTYHFDLEQRMYPGMLNWAEELRDAIHHVLVEYADLQDELQSDKETRLFPSK